MLAPIVVALVCVALTILVPLVCAVYAIITCGTSLASIGVQKPEILTKAVIVVVLAEALAIYGLLVSFMLLAKLDVLSSSPQVDVALTKAIFATIVMCAAATIAMMGIVHTGSAMAGAMVERPETFSGNVVSVVLADALAIYGLLISFMIIAKI